MDPASNAPTTKAHDISRVLSEVLGDLAFMVAENDDVELMPGTVWLEGEITYEGPARGTLRMWCTRDFATRLAANLLGMEPDDGSAQIGGEDAVREFMNVLCGQVITAWYGHEAVFDLSIPTVSECVQIPESATGDGCQHCEVSIEGEPLLCAVQRED